MEQTCPASDGNELHQAALGKSPKHGYLFRGMKIMQMTKRILLLVVVNILVMTTITLVLGVLGVGRYFPQGGLGGLECWVLLGVGARAALRPDERRAEDQARGEEESQGAGFGHDRGGVKAGERGTDEYRGGDNGGGFRDRAEPLELSLSTQGIYRCL